jgi:hypothetical protein
MAARLDIMLQRNEGWAKTLRITDSDDVPIDLTGCVLAMQVREKLTQTLITQAEVTIENASVGIVSIVLPGGPGSALGRYGSPIQTVNLHHDLLMTDSQGAPVVLFSGVVVLSRGETRA